MADKVCVGCGRAVEAYLNWCSWDCMVDHAKKRGGRTIAPNGLPIASIRSDGTMLEHEHADHDGYRFPVMVAFGGPLPEEFDEVDRRDLSAKPALLFAGGNVVLTICECRYDIWRLDDGGHLAGSRHFDGWRLTAESLEKIREVPRFARRTTMAPDGT